MILRRPQTQPSQKVFCVGFNKTGTTSLHAFFNESGLRSAHNTVWPFYSHANKPEGHSYFQAAQCYSDGELCDFEKLDKWFPSACFILNTRNERAWLCSRIKHVLRFGMPHSFRSVEMDKQYGTMAKDFFSNEALAISSWVTKRRIYEARARNYFSSRTNFLELSVTEDPDWQNQLSSHLLRNNVLDAAPMDIGKIHANKRAPSNVPTTELERYLRLADDIVSQIDGLSASGK